MSGLTGLLLFASLISVLIARHQLVKRVRARRRDRLMSIQISEEWQKYLESNVSLYSKLPNNLRLQIHGHTQVLLDEKVFEGHNGLKMTDEIRITIAGQASFLLLNQKGFFPDAFRSVIVYPSAYKTRSVKTGLGGLHTESRQLVLGQSWDIGTVVLAWDNTRHSAANPNDGHNLVLHEFAHQLDQATGAANGTPFLKSRDRYGEWRRTMSCTYRDFLDDTKRGKKTVIDDYAATNPAEFFSVATETFLKNLVSYKSGDRNCIQNYVNITAPIRLNGHLKIKNLNRRFCFLTDEVNAPTVADCWGKLLVQHIQNGTGQEGAIIKVVDNELMVGRKGNAANQLFSG